ncbi:MAG TPA: hypothetical protein DEG71_10035, partial [Clostridiales bacterium]|nr:hypothetical protein [Clostridiales bacterium]
MKKLLFILVTLASIAISNNSFSQSCDVRLSEYYWDAFDSDTICPDMGNYRILANVDDTAQYLWSNGETGIYIYVNPVSNSTYTVTATFENGCTATASFTFVIIDASFKVKLPNDTTIESGTSIVLNPIVTGGSGTYNYKWQYGVTTKDIVASPNKSTSYILTVNDGICNATDGIAVRIQGDTLCKSINIKNDYYDTICPNGHIYLQAYPIENYDQYKWSNGSSSYNLDLNLSITTTYTVTVTRLNGCTSSDDFVVTVLPEIIIELPDDTINKGDTIILNPIVTGGSSSLYDYLWYPSYLKTLSIAVSPNTSTTYRIKVSSGNCYANKTIKVLVADDTLVSCSVKIHINNTLEIGDTARICPGDNTYLILSGGVYPEYLWNTGNKSDYIYDKIDSSMTYTVTVKNLWGCTASDSYFVEVTPVFVDAGANQVICLGDSVRLVAKGT